MTIPNQSVGPAAHKLSWKSGKWRNRLFSTQHAGRTLTAVWVYRKRWAVSVNGKYLPHYFEGPAAAKRYLAGAAISD